MNRILALALLAALAAAADSRPEPIGVWRFGLGTVDGEPAKVGTLVSTGQIVVSADAAPLRLVCSEAPGITIVLAAGSSGRFSLERTSASDAPLLVLELDRGAVQMDVRDRGPYAGVRVRGASADVRVTGTLFTVERVRRDADYVALARGKVKVGLRPAVAKAANRPADEEVELTEHQGLSADASGLGQPEPLSRRPQVHMAAGLRTGLREQGLGLSDQGTTDWDSDLAGVLTGIGLEGGGDLGGEPSGPPPFLVLAEDLANTLGELGMPPQDSGDSATEISHPGSTTPPGGLPPPPPPPP